VWGRFRRSPKDDLWPMERQPLDSSFDGVAHQSLPNGDPSSDQLCLSRLEPTEGGIFGAEVLEPLWQNHSSCHVPGTSRSP